jgi:hypothetical protein
VVYSLMGISSTNLDAFSYTVGDGRGGQATGWVQVTTLDAIPQLRFQATNANFPIQFRGIAGLVYRIESDISSNFPTPLTIGSKAVDSAGAFFYPVTNASVGAWFRVVYP